MFGWGGCSVFPLEFSRYISHLKKWFNKLLKTWKKWHENPQCSIQSCINLLNNNSCLMLNFDVRTYTSFYFFFKGWEEGELLDLFNQFDIRVWLALLVFSFFFSSTGSTFLSRSKLWFFTFPISRLIKPNQDQIKLKQTTIPKPKGTLLNYIWRKTL